MNNRLHLLLSFLAKGKINAETMWQNWRITPIHGGANNLLYRVAGDEANLAIKFTIKDQRKRAQREYNALLALQQVNLPIAPAPILLEQERYPQPVVVQSWLNGEVSARPPTSNEDWLYLLQHLHTIHSITPHATDISLPGATLTAHNVSTGRKIVRKQLACLPLEARPATLQALINHFDNTGFTDWATAPITLCRCDPNSLNFIRRPGAWASVDWEYSGWGDPAFEIADLITHPAYLSVADSRWEWVIDTYTTLSGDAQTGHRIHVYRKILLVWWAARLCRYLYEIPRGLDQRLTQRSNGWQADMQAKYKHYLQLAEKSL